jgi:hypothetical protein
MSTTDEPESTLLMPISRPMMSHSRQKTSQNVSVPASVHKPKACTFEGLPLEIRETIYAYMGITAVKMSKGQRATAVDESSAKYINVRSRWWERSGSKYMTVYWWQRPRQDKEGILHATGGDMLRINRVIRSEVLDLLLRTRVVQFDYCPIDAIEVMAESHSFDPRQVQIL